MGGKRAGAGKCVLFFRACCLVGVFWFFGCTFLHENPHRTFVSGSGAEGLRWAEAFCEQGDYSASLSEAERVYKAYPKEAGDRALFQIGLVKVCPSNPNQDYDGALEAFGRIQKEFPESPLKPEAAMLETLLQRVLAAEAKLETLGGENKKLTKRLAREQKKAESFKAQTETYRLQADELRNQLLQLKEIDMVLEEKKNQVK